MYLHLFSIFEVFMIACFWHTIYELVSGASTSFCIDGLEMTNPSASTSRLYQMATLVCKPDSSSLNCVYSFLKNSCFSLTIIQISISFWLTRLLNPQWCGIRLFSCCSPLLFVEGIFRG